MTIPALRASLVQKFQSPLGQKLFRYSMASVVAVIVSVISLLIFVGLIRMGVVLASTLATSIAAIPSYQMNRKWAWGKSGKSHLMKEVLPFWALALLGWGFSTYSVKLMDNYAKENHYSHLVQTFLVVVVYFSSFAVLWVGKFVIFNKIMFVHHQHQAEQRPAAGDTADKRAAV